MKKESFKRTLKSLESSEKFKKWKKEHPDSFLSYGFKIFEKKQNDWKIGYYNAEHNNIVSFNTGESITIEKEEEVFKEEQTKVEGIDIDKINVEIHEAIVIADKLQKEQYKADNPVKIIVILQKLPIGQVWNITYLTQSMNTLNMKIDSSNGSVLEHKIVSLFGFEKGVK